MLFLIIRPERITKSPMPLFWTAYAAMLFASFVDSWLMFLITLVSPLLMAALVFAKKRRRWGGKKIDLDRALAPVQLPRTTLTLRTASGILILLIGGVVFTPRPWIPKETIIHADGTSTVGYVLGQSGDDLEVLADSPRGVTRVPAKDATRFYCVNGERNRKRSGWRVLITLRPVAHMVGNTTYLACGYEPS